MTAPDDNRTVSPSPVAGEGPDDATMLDTVERLDAALTEASYTVREASGLTGVSGTSIRQWLSGYPRIAYELKSPWEMGRRPDPLLVSFIELMEILMVGNIRVATGGKFAAIRKYHDDISWEWGTLFPFAHENLLELATQGERPLKSVAKTLAQMDYENGYVALWYPMGKDQPIAVDPHRGSGAPTIKGRRLRVVDIRGQFKAGETIQRIAEDFVLEPPEVEAALRYAFLSSL